MYPTFIPLLESKLMIILEKGGQGISAAFIETKMERYYYYFLMHKSPNNPMDSDHEMIWAKMHLEANKIAFLISMISGSTMFRSGISWINPS